MIGIATGAKLMRSCIRRIFSFSVLAIIAAVLLLPLSGATHDRSPKAGHYTIFSEIVGADPGEDPHLKVGPQVDPGFVRDFHGGTSSTTADGVNAAIMGRSRVKAKLLFALQILIGPLLK